MENNTEHYLDNSATTQVLPEAAQRAVELMVCEYGNPSSLHTRGFKAKQELEGARVVVASRLGVSPQELVFTGGGTEGNNMALFGAAMAKRRLGSRIVTTGLEHDSVLNAMKELEKQGFEVIYLSSDSTGNISQDELAEAIDEKTILVSIMLVNNETGAILPVQAAAKAIRQRKAPALLHTDGVQAFGKLDFSPKKLGAHLCTISAHKLHGPKGVGALYVAKSARIIPRTLGGGQERGLRPGTESLPLIAAFAKAVELTPRPVELLPHIRGLNELLRRRLLEIPLVEINSPEDCLPYILSFSAGRVKAETMLHFLAQKGIYCSSGSACSRAKPSHVLEAMGLSKSRISSSLRASFSRFSTEEDVNALALALAEGLERLAAER